MPLTHRHHQDLQSFQHSARCTNDSWVLMNKWLSSYRLYTPGYQGGVRTDSGRLPSPWTFSNTLIEVRRLPLTFHSPSFWQTILSLPPIILSYMTTISMATLYWQSLLGPWETFKIVAAGGLEQWTAPRSIAPTVLPEDLGSIPCTHIEAHNHLYPQSQGILLRLSRGTMGPINAQTYMQAKYPEAQNKKEK